MGGNDDGDHLIDDGQLKARLQFWRVAGKPHQTPKDESPVDRGGRGEYREDDGHGVDHEEHG